MTCSGRTNTRCLTQADEARMELAACKSELACSTSLWEKKRQEMSAQLNKYKSRCSALERKRSSDISGLAHDVNCLQRSVRLTRCVVSLGHTVTPHRQRSVLNSKTHHFLVRLLPLHSPGAGRAGEVREVGYCGISLETCAICRWRECGVLWA